MRAIPQLASADSTRIMRVIVTDLSLSSPAKIERSMSSAHIDTLPGRAYTYLESFTERSRSSLEIIITIISLKVLIYK